MTRPLLVLGREGQVARELAALAPGEGWTVTRIGRAEADLSTADLAPLLAEHRPALVVNAAAYTAVDRAESDEPAARALNADLPRRAARACADAGTPFVHISTDYVFDGSKPAPYVEADPLAPLGVYGRTKAEGEAAVAEAGGDAAVVRTSWVFGAEGANFVRTMLRLAETRDEVGVVADQLGRPTWSRDVALACLKLGDQLCAGDRDAQGVFHAAGEGDATWAEFAEAIFAQSARSGGPAARVRPISTAEFPTAAVRPANSRLDSSKLYRTISWRPGSWSACLPEVMTGMLAT